MHSNHGKIEMKNAFTHIKLTMQLMVTINVSIMKNFNLLNYY